MTRTQRRRRLLVATVFVLVLGLLTPFAYKAYMESTHRNVCTVIEQTERTDDTMYVYTEAGTFVMEDAIGWGTPQRFSTSDEFGRLSEGDDVCFDVYGWRLPLFSQYPNAFIDSEGGK